MSECQLLTNTASLQSGVLCLGISGNLSLGIVAYFVSESWRTLCRNRGVLWSGISSKSITDLFLYSEKILDENKREVLVVELKAPKVKVSPKELSQVMKYAQEIEDKSVFPDRLNYKILLVTSEIGRAANYDITGRQKGQENPYFYHRNDRGNIEVWVIKWADLIENVKRKLKYMSAMLNVKDVDVQEKATRDFEDIDFGRISSTLKKVV